MVSECFCYLDIIYSSIIDISLFFLVGETAINTYQHCQDFSNIDFLKVYC